MSIKASQHLWVFDPLLVSGLIQGKRVELKLSLSQLGALSDISTSNISRIEQAGFTNMEMLTFLAICNNLELSPADFFTIMPASAAKMQHLVKGF